jgi:D-glycero-alpha-D-manno-heptose-7-phosphate kinase
MIISKSPFRISFAGGGSDLASFYQQDYGAVLSSSIDKYVFIAVHRFFEKGFLLKYSQSERAEYINDIKHPLIRECLHACACQDDLEITSFADIPSTGSGLGSSSAFCVGLINNLMAHQGKLLGKEALAATACEVEIGRLGEPIGKQDQYASAYGGLNHIRFNPDESVHVTPVILSKNDRAHINDSLLLFYTGVTRKASSVLTEQNANMKSSTEKLDAMKRIRDGADRLFHDLMAGDLDAIGREMHAGWLLKRTMATGVSNPDLDEIYQQATSAGALGGKLLGAGGGGFFLFHCPPERQHDLRHALSRLREVPIELEQQGSRIIYVDD